MINNFRIILHPIAISFYVERDYVIFVYKIQNYTLLLDYVEKRPEVPVPDT